MTKQEIGGAEILSSLKPLSYPGDSNFDIFAERRKSVYNRPILERSWSKQYLDGVLQVACVFKAVPDKEGVVFSSHDQNSGIGFDNVGFGVRRYTGHQIPITIKNQEFFSGFESKPAERRDEYLVLILDVEFVQIIKIVAPPFERLQFFEDVFDDNLGWLGGIWPTSTGSLYRASRISKWEGALASKFTSVCLDSYPVRVLEANSEVVDSISDKSWRMFWESRRDGGKALLPNVTVFLGHSGFNVRVDMFPDNGFELEDVMVGPFPF